MIATALRRGMRLLATPVSRIARAALSLAVVATIVPVAFAPNVAAAAPVTTADLYGVDFVDANVGYAVGSGGTVVKTTDGGAHWTTKRSGDSYEFRGVSFIDANNGWIMSLTGVGFKTTDGGETWTTLTTDVGGVFYAGERIYALARLAAEAGVAVGTAQGVPAVGFHKYASDNSWILGTYPELWGGSYDPPETEPPFPKAGAGVFYGMDFYSANLGWVVGHDTYTGVVPAADAPMIWNWDVTRAGSGAADWAQQTLTGTGALFDVAFATTTQGVAVGHDGMVQRTSNGGATWTADDVGTNDELYGVELTTTGQSWAVGEWGSVMRSADNGDTWTQLSSPTSSQLEDIEWLGGDTAVAVGAAGAIIKTSNGTTWSLSNSDTGGGDPPTMTSLTSSSHPSETTWAKSTTVNAAWSATAGGAAISGYGVVLDQSASTVPASQTTAATSGTFTASNGSGDYWLHARAKDANNQWSSTLHRKVRVDVTAPSATFAPAASYNGSASVPLTATDAHSGVASVSYKIDGGSTTTVSGASTNVSIGTLGTHDVTYWATDAVGNITAEDTKQVVVNEVTEPLTPVERKVEGAGRYATAIESAKLHFSTPMAAGPDGHKWVVIASGTNWPDALAASGLAGALEAPLLLTTPDDLRPEVAAYIDQLGADRAAIVGGTAAVSVAVASDLSALVGGGGNVVRYGESSRYATANLIASKTVTVPGRTPWDGTAFLGTGGNFPDALAAAPLSAAKGWPLYLAQPVTGVSDATIAAMKAAGVDRVVVLGGTGVVPESSVTRLKAQGITAVERWNGSDRYDTARVVAEKSILEGLSPEFSGLATGANFPDALAGGVVQGLSGSVLVLTPSTSLSAAARTYFTNHKGEIAEIRFFGGTAAVSAAVRQAALQAATP